MKAKLTEGSIGWHIVKLSLPILFSVFAIAAFNMTDTYFVSRLGTNTIAAMSFTFPVVSTLGNLAIGLGVGTASVIARSIGQGDRRQVQRLTTDSLFLSLTIAIIIVLIGLGSIDQLFTVLGTQPDIVPLVREYMETYYLAFFFMLLAMTANNSIRAAGNTIVPALSMMVATLVNLVLDPLLIFGLAGLPRLEIRGAALATAIAQAITLIIAITILYRERMVALKLVKFKRLLKSWRDILHVGIPSAATNIIKPLSLGLIMGMIAVYGTGAIAGFGIASRLEALLLIVFFGMSASIGPIVGQNWGAGKFERVNRAFLLGTKFCLIGGIIIAVFVSIVVPRLIPVFDDNREVISTAVAYLTIVPISYAASGVMMVASSTFNAIGKPKPSFVIKLIHMLVLYLPLALIGKQLFDINGIFAAACLSNVIVGLVAFFWNRKTFKVMFPDKSLQTFAIANQSRKY